jgi:hypothetical protein
MKESIENLQKIYDAGKAACLAGDRRLSNPHRNSEPLTDRRAADASVWQQGWMETFSIQSGCVVNTKQSSEIYIELRDWDLTHRKQHS